MTSRKRLCKCKGKGVGRDWCEEVGYLRGMERGGAEKGG